jgi:hypothetical protein
MAITKEFARVFWYDVASVDYSVEASGTVIPLPVSPECCVSGLRSTEGVTSITVDKDPCYRYDSASETVSREDDLFPGMLLYSLADKRL